MVAFAGAYLLLTRVFADKVSEDICVVSLLLVPDSLMSPEIVIDCEMWGRETPINSLVLMNEISSKQPI